MALWLPVLVPVYRHHWSIAPLEVLEPLSVGGVEEHERSLTHTVAKVVKVAISSFPPCRTGAVMTLQIGSLGHDLASPAHRGSTSSRCPCCRDHSHSCNLASKLLDLLFLLVVYLAAVISHTPASAQLSKLAEMMSSAVWTGVSSSLSLTSDRSSLALGWMSSLSTNVNCYVNFHE